MIFNNLNFAGVNSIDYGIYITGEAVYNVPERSVEFVSIAGRDGDLILDNGHFENIEVTYPAGCFGEDQTSFADKVRAFRNAIASKKGYQRLTDSYNPNEYRLATFVNGVEVEPTSYGRAGEFELVFNCQPFRYLMSGESEIEVTSGDEIANPTLFESKPLIEVEGYGALNVNGYEISISNSPLGKTLLQNGYQIIDRTNQEVSYYDRIKIENNILNQGDTITATLTASWDISISDHSAVYSLGKPTNKRIVDPATETTVTDAKLSVKALSKDTIRVTITKNITYGWGDETVHPRYKWYFDIKPLDPDGSEAWGTITLTATTGFWATTFDTTQELVFVQDIYDFSATASGLPTYFVEHFLAEPSVSAVFKNVVGDATVVLTGHPIYIDCDIGQAYNLDSDEPMSLDAYIDLGSDLPVLGVGESEITFDNTITDVKIVPRWRQI